MEDDSRKRRWTRPLTVGVFLCLTALGVWLLLPAHEAALLDGARKLGGPHFDYQWLSNREIVYAEQSLVGGKFTGTFNLYRRDLGIWSRHDHPFVQE